MSIYNKLIIGISILTVIVVIYLNIFPVAEPKTSYEGFAATPISEYTININTANAEELAHCTGLGEKTAEAIVEYREKNGKYSSVDDLLNVRGIGAKKLDEWREVLCVK